MSAAGRGFTGDRSDLGAIFENVWIQDGSGAHLAGDGLFAELEGWRDAAVAAERQRLAGPEIPQAAEPEAEAGG